LGRRIIVFGSYHLLRGDLSHLMNRSKSPGLPRFSSCFVLSLGLASLPQALPMIESGSTSVIHFHASSSLPIPLVQRVVQPGPGTKASCIGSEEHVNCWQPDEGGLAEDEVCHVQCQGLGDDAQGGGEEEDGGSERGGDKGEVQSFGWDHEHVDLVVYLTPLQLSYTKQQG